MSEVLDFSANINDFIKVKNIMIKNEYIRNYPENNLNEYKALLAGDNFGIDNISIVSGLTSFIHLFMRSIDGNVIIISPAFTEYVKAPANGKKILIPFNAVNKNPEIIKNFDFDVLFLVYPDSPTGQMLDRESLFSLIENARKKNSIVFIDESFIWFVNGREINESDIIKRYQNVIIGRSLTKIMAVPGLRLAYILSNPETISGIEKILEPWRINEPALIYLANNKNDFRDIGEKTEIERKYIMKSIKKMGLEVIGNPRANYITLRLPLGCDGDSLKAYLAGMNIMIRLLDDYSEFGNGYIRVNVKRRVKNRVLLNALSDYIGGVHG
jgi:histidinol-phosphate/aromatic aminotransferase/cobyric acid decarboxylase-like protein